VRQYLPRSAAGVALAVAVVLVIGGAAAPAGAGAAPAAGRAPAPVTSSLSSAFPVRDSVLNGVSAVSGSDAWAVGYETGASALASTTLILHWNGTAWSPVKSPNPGSYSNQLYGVSAVSGSDAWAVGSYTDPSGGALTYKTLILHWNGTAWSKVDSPNPSPGTFNELYGVSAVSGSDAWAVGRYSDGPAIAYATLILHWNGTAWTQVQSPNPGTDPLSSPANYLDGVSARSGSDAWAVGGYDNDRNGTGIGSLVAHWNGTAWTQITSPAAPYRVFGLDGVSAVSGSDAWAVGDYSVSGEYMTSTLILHWNGTAWTQVNSPSPGPGQSENGLDGVSAVSGSDAWAVGNYNSDVNPAHDTLILHWNGTAWTQVKSPSPSRTDNFLTGVSAVSGSGAWAVGYDNNAFGDYQMLVLRWNGTAWANAPAVKTATSVSSSANPVTTGNRVTYTATVTPTPAQNVGTVNFYDNGSRIRGCSTNIGPGRFTCTVIYDSDDAGSHTIKATYSGYSVLAGRSTSPPLTETVTAPAQPRGQFHPGR